MTKLLLNGLKEVKFRLNQINDKINEFRFGLTLISKKRYNYYFRVFMLSSTAVTTGVYFSYNSFLLNDFKSVVSMYS